MSLLKGRRIGRMLAAAGWRLTKDALWTHRQLSSRPLTAEEAMLLTLVTEAARKGAHGLVDFARTCSPDGPFRDERWRRWSMLLQIIGQTMQAQTLQDEARNEAVAPTPRGGFSGGASDGPCPCLWKWKEEHGETLPPHGHAPNCVFAPIPSDGD